MLSVTLPGELDCLSLPGEDPDAVCTVMNRGSSTTVANIPPHA